MNLARQVSPSGGRNRSNFLTLDTDLLKLDADLGQWLVRRSRKDLCEEKVDTA